MKKFTVNIWAYDHHARFQVESNDDPISLEQAIVDKLGLNDIKWEHLGEMHDPRVKRITYEEVIDGTDDATLERPILEKEGSGSTVGARAS